MVQLDSTFDKNSVSQRALVLKRYVTWRFLPFVDDGGSQRRSVAEWC